MALSDFAGGVQDAIADVIKERLLRQEEARRAEMEQQRAKLSERGVALNEQQFKRLQDADAREIADKDARRGFLRTVAGDPSKLRSMISSPEGRLSLMDEGGIGNPDELMPPEPPKPKEHMVTTYDAQGRAVQRLASEDELRGGVRPYQAPKAPSAPRQLRQVDLGDRIGFVDDGGNVVREIPKGQRPGAGESADPAKAQERTGEVKALATELLKDPSLGAVFGPLQGRMPTLRGGTADAEAKIDRLQSLLTLDNLGLMKGVLSDTDIKILQRAATVLSNRTISDGQARAELQRISGAGASTVGGGNTDVPAGVSAALASAPDGVHTLSDGSTWIKQNGQIRPGGR
jgi:hypothetical protein